MKKAIWALLAIISITSSALAAGVCDAALILSTYNSFSSDHIDWRLATFVSDKEWEQVRHDQGANAVIYGIPVGETYSDFQNRVREKISVYHESLTHNQMLNILWTGLDPNAVTAYSNCLQSQLFATRGLHLAVKSATKNDISLLVSWNPQGKDPATIDPSWIWAVKGKDKLPASLQQGLTTVVLLRPAQAHTFAVNYPGFTDAVVVEPLVVVPDRKPIAEWHPVDKDGRPYMATWTFPANCNGQYGLMTVDPTHRCEIDRTQVHIGGSNDPFDTWSLWIDAPPGAQVQKVDCEALGQNIIEVRGIPQGPTGLCTGRINGGTGPIRMTIYWNQLW
jgi:hypothetical protein